MGKLGEAVTTFQESDEEDDAWLAGLISKFGDKEESTKVQEESPESLQDDLTLVSELDHVDNIAEQYEQEMAAKVRKPGKGGTKPNTKQRDARTEQLRAEQIKNSREKRNAEAIETLQTQLADSGLFKLVKNKDPDADSFVETYAHWVVESIVKNHGTPILEPGDILVENIRRASGPGGQNMQKGESGRQAGHIWSGIVVEANSRSSEQSLKEAKEKLEMKLKENITTWENFLGTAEIEVKPNESIQGARERAIRTQVYKMARTP